MKSAFRLSSRLTARSFLVVAACATASLHAQRIELADATASAVVVESADIKTEVTGRIAVTTFDLIFRNPNGRVLEGTFVLPLLDGQSVTRFALDMNGALREAVPVDKVHGRVVFEEIERRRVDPGLLEQTAGNNYRARVFPIPPSGTRRIVVAYQEDVVRGSVEATYRLNLDFPARLKTFRLAVAAFAGGASAKVRTTLGLDLPAWRDGKFMEIERADFTPRGVLELILPPVDRPRVLTGRRGDEEYFYAEAPVVLAPRPRPAPRAVGLLWDSSGSGRDRDHARECALLDAWFATIGSVEVHLVRLRDHAEPAGKFTVRDGKWRSLRTELDRTDYDGATSLDGLKDDPAIDEWLLFTDGLINYGATPATEKLKLHGAVHAVLASPRADPVWMRGLAARHGGEFVNLLETTAAPAAAHLRSQSPRVLRVESNPNEVAEVFPAPGGVVTGSPMVVAGVLRGESAAVRLRIGTSERDAEIVEIVVRTGENASPLAASGWASAKIAQLSLNHAANRADIRRTSREFGIVTGDTSLIVLETIADYVRYDIAPPAELRREWEDHRTLIASDRGKGRASHLETIVRAFEDRVAWWEKSFPKDTPPAPQKNRALVQQDQRRAGTTTLDAPLALSVQAEPPAMSAPPPSLRAASDETVTLSPFVVASDRSASLSAGAMMVAQSSARARGTASTASEPKAKAAATPSGIPTITLQRWSPDTGYLDHVRRVDEADAYSAYLEERVRHSRQPGFFLDVASLFFERGDAPLGLRILSNLAELELEDVALLRVLAHRLVQADRPDLALPLFERVLALRPDEPQSRRDLALVCADLKRYQRAVDLLWEVVAETWSPRFPQIELIALTELNAIAATCGETLDLSRVDPRLRRNLPVQTRVVLTWDTNDCDIDLWVTDPNAEIAIYNNPLTYQGGRMSSDFTAGYGPEEFILRDPKPGKYRVKLDYFGDRRQTALGPVTAQVRFITGFGTAAQQEKRTTLRLDDRKQKIDAGTFEVAPPAKKLHAAVSRPGD